MWPRHPRRRSYSGESQWILVKFSWLENLHMTHMDPRSSGHTEGDMSSHGKEDQPLSWSETAGDDGVGDSTTVINSGQSPKRM